MLSKVFIRKFSSLCFQQKVKQFIQVGLAGSVGFTGICLYKADQRFYSGWAMPALQESSFFATFVKKNRKKLPPFGVVLCVDNRQTMLLKWNSIKLVFAITLHSNNFRKHYYVSYHTVVTTFCFLQTVLSDGESAHEWGVWAAERGLLVPGPKLRSDAKQGRHPITSPTLVSFNWFS